MRSAFERHFGGDKGFGPSAGSRASKLIADRLALAGYAIERGRSDWQLGAADAKLVAILADGWAEAAFETAACRRRRFRIGAPRANRRASPASSATRIFRLAASLDAADP